MNSFVDIQAYSFKMHWKMSSIKWQPFIYSYINTHIKYKTKEWVSKRLRKGWKNPELGSQTTDQFSSNVLYNIAIYYSDVIMREVASQIAGVLIVCSTVCSGADQRKHQSSASLDFVRGINRWPVNFPHKRPVTREMFPFDDVIMISRCTTRKKHGTGTRPQMRT